MLMLVILAITTAAIIGTFFVSLGRVWKGRRQRNKILFSSETGDSSQDLAMPFLFDRPTKWLAIRCSNILKVQTALGLHNPTPCSWREGFSKLHEGKLFISPPVKGWVIVVGQNLPEPSDDIDKLYHFLMKLGADLGSIQYFNSSRVLNHHAWIRIENNRVYRAYAWAGETLWNQGDCTAAENELELKTYEYGETPIPFPFSARDSHVANTDKVLQLAARWSVDPLAVNSQTLKASLGITGDLSRLHLR